MVWGRWRGRFWERIYVKGDHGKVGRYMVRSSRHWGFGDGFGFPSPSIDISRYHGRGPPLHLTDGVEWKSRDNLRMLWFGLGNRTDNLIETLDTLVHSLRIVYCFLVMVCLLLPRCYSHALTNVVYYTSRRSIYVPFARATVYISNALRA